MYLDNCKVLCYNEAMNKIKEFLAQNDMTQAELAAKLKYNETYISLIVNGHRTPKDAFRWRWQQAFGKASLKVLDGDGPAQEA